MLGIKTVLIGLATLSIAGSASATLRLSDLQLDTVTAGQLLGVQCPGCTLAASTSMSNNGVTTTTNSITIVSGGGNGGSGGGNGGSGGGNGGSGGNGSGVPSGPGVVTTIPVPANVAGIINAASTITINP